MKGFSIEKKMFIPQYRYPRSSGVKKLKGRQAWRIRQGDYRIIYEIRDKVLTVTVIALGHRKDVYK